MTTIPTLDPAYTSDIHEWQQTMEAQMRSETGWLTVVGLDWLEEGDNSVGSDPASAVVLPNASVPAHLGMIRFDGAQAELHIAADTPVQIEGVPVTTAALRDDAAEGGPTLVQVGTVTFFIVRRGDQVGVRIRDTASEVRRTFTGRVWFPVDAALHVTGQFIAHAPGQTIEVENMIGTTTVYANPGRVTFSLHGQDYSLEAFAGDPDSVWFVFRDATSGVTTYGASRFVYAPRAADGTVTLDFNKAYHPPCAFTAYATCPLPPRGNHLPIPIHAGERLPAAGN